MKLNNELLTAILATVITVIATMMTESFTIIDPSVLLVYTIAIIEVNYIFEKVHANKRALFGGDQKPILMEVVMSSAITFITFILLTRLVDSFIGVTYWNTPVICSMSVIIGYFINYIRFKGKKGVYVTLFTSNRRIKERLTVYRLESLYDKRDITILDIMLIYGYISFKELEDARLIFKTTKVKTIEDVLISSGEITKDDIEEAEYILEKYKENKTFMSKEEFRNYKIERQMVMDRYNVD